MRLFSKEEIVEQVTDFYEIKNLEQALTSSRRGKGVHNDTFAKEKSECSYEHSIGRVTGLEPATSASRTWRSTKLSHTSKKSPVYWGYGWWC